MTPEQAIRQIREGFEALGASVSSGIDHVFFGRGVRPPEITWLEVGIESGQWLRVSVAAHAPEGASPVSCCVLERIPADGGTLVQTVWPSAPKPSPNTDVAP